MNRVLGDTLIGHDNSSEESFVFEGDSVLIRRYLWGLYQGVAIKVSYERFSRAKGFLYGSTLPDDMKGCLYLADHQRPVTLVGNTRLAGDVFAPATGLQAGAIGGLSFSGARLTEGRVLVSGAELPPIQPAGLAYLYALADNAATITNASAVPDSLSNGSAAAAYDLAFAGPVYLRQQLAGKIVIRSDTLIEVGRTAALADIILVAPVIHLESGFHGRLQAFATRQLLVDDSCVLDYPSALVVINKSGGAFRTACTVGRACMIGGTILSLAPAPDHHGSTVKLASHTIVEGVVYVNGDLSLGATVYGTVATDWFIHTTPSTVYENYLNDISINRRLISRYFIGSPFFNASQTRKIIQWLD